MSAHAYTEDRLVEQPALGLFAELGWATVSALEETFGATGTLLRETKGEVVLVSRLRAALERLNPALPPEAITAAVDELTRDRSAMSLEAANREVYLLLKEGIRVSVADTGLWRNLRGFGSHFLGLLVNFQFRIGFKSAAAACCCKSRIRSRVEGRAGSVLRQAGKDAKSLVRRSPKTWILLQSNME